MSELTIKIPRRAAWRLSKAIDLILAGSNAPDERYYFLRLQEQLKKFAEEPEPIHGKVTVLAWDGVPTGEK